MNRCEYYHGYDADGGHVGSPTLNGLSLDRSFVELVWVEFTTILPGINACIRSSWITFITFWYEGITDSKAPWSSFTVWLIGNWTLDTFWSSTFCKIKYLQLLFCHCR